MSIARQLIPPALGLALICSLASEASAERLGVVTNDGRGGGYRKGGTYVAIKLDRLTAHDRLSYRVLSGHFKYWTIHARYKGGYWRTLYKGPQKTFHMAHIHRLINRQGRKRPTHLNFSVNGAHERYEPVACRLAILRNAQAVHPPAVHPPAAVPGQIGIVTNDGRGGGYRRGGTYAAVKYNKFGHNDRVGYRVISGTFRYWTVHARYNGGFWKTVYRGAQNFIPMAQIRQRIAQLRKGRPTHLNFSVNGAHERYDRVACRLAIVQRFGSAPPPPVAHTGGIQIVAGTYGQNCGTRRGNKTGHLRRMCQGRRSCVYTIDYRVIGDPRRGCGKNYIAEWRCAGNPRLHRAVASPEAGFRKQIHLRCGHHAGQPPTPPPSYGHGPGHGQHHGKGIKVVAGTYGQNCGARRGNKTGHLRRSCQGRRSCVYTIDYRVIGDPRRGCGKNYIAEWRCGRSPALRRAVVAPEAGHRKQVTLSCGAHHVTPPPPPPPPRPTQVLRLFRAVPKQSSANFRHRRYQKLRVATTQYDQIPYKIATPATYMVTVQPGQRCFLAGNPTSTAGFRIDNFLFVQIGSSRGRNQRHFIVGVADPVTFRGRPVPRLGPRKFAFRAGEIDLTPYLPKGVPTRVKVTALDYGAVGQVSNLYLIVR